MFIAVLASYFLRQPGIAKYTRYTLFTVHSISGAGPSGKLALRHKKRPKNFFMWIIVCVVCIIGNNIDQLSIESIFLYFG